MGIDRLEYYANIFQKYVGMIAESYVGDDRTINDEIMRLIKIELDRHAERLCASHKQNVHVIMEAHIIIWKYFATAMVELSEEGKGEKDVGRVEEGQAN